MRNRAPSSGRSLDTLAAQRSALTSAHSRACTSKTRFVRKWLKRKHLGKIVPSRLTLTARRWSIVRCDPNASKRCQQMRQTFRRVFGQTIRNFHRGLPLRRSEQERQSAGMGIAHFVPFRTMKGRIIGKQVGAVCPSRVSGGRRAEQCFAPLPTHGIVANSSRAPNRFVVWQHWFFWQEMGL